MFTKRLQALVYTETLICGNFAVYSPVNGRKSGVIEIEWQGIAYLSLYRYMAIYVVFYFD